jgi:hypothetical protein
MDYGVDPEHDEHRHRSDAHYRLYDHPTLGPTTICVQWFDYHDYIDGRIMSPRAYDTEEEAEAALHGGTMIVPTADGPRLYEFRQVVE